jgi:NAD(P)-dependent dehydrogenase (short-subunit alcohol dehydrogenase family)
VITGSTRGIGYGLADAFLARGCGVVVSGRTLAAVEHAVTGLSSLHGTDRILGHRCDVTRFEEVRSLWEAAQARFGKVDIWINNAGISHLQANLWAQPPDEIGQVVATNLVGAMYGARVALEGMLAQGSGSLYNMEGLGSNGRQIAGLSLYGTTKYALKYLTDALVRETKGTPVLVGALRPGMVVTDLLTQQRGGPPEQWDSARRIFNILADRVETVAPRLAEQVLANSKTGVRFQWLTRWKLLGRFLAAPFRKRELFD